MVKRQPAETARRAQRRASVIAQRGLDPDPAARRALQPRWKWRTFPVFFAFAVGLLIASVINAPPQNLAAAALQIGAIFAVGYGFAHLFVTNVIVAGRLRRRDMPTARGEPRPGPPALDEEDEWEEEIVYPDEESRA